MRGELIGVWSETWREIWLPLIDQPLGDSDESVPEDIFCELYRELAKALRKPTDSAAVSLLLCDAIALREVFDGAAQRANQDLGHELVKEAFDKSGAEEVVSAEQRKACLETALSSLLGQPAAQALDAQLREHARDDAKVTAAWNRAVERTINDAQASREAFEKITAEDLAGERALVGFSSPFSGFWRTSRSRQATHSQIGTSICLPPSSRSTTFAMTSGDPVFFARRYPACLRVSSAISAHCRPRIRISML
jgi:hypothetical protein